MAVLHEFPFKIQNRYLQAAQRMVAYSKQKFVADVRHLTITFEETSIFGHYSVVLMQLTSHLVSQMPKEADELVRHLTS